MIMARTPTLTICPRIEESSSMLSARTTTQTIYMTMMPETMYGAFVPRVMRYSPNMMSATKNMSMKSMNVNGMKSMACRFTMTKEKTQTCGYVCVVFFSVCGVLFQSEQRAALFMRGVHSPVISRKRRHLP